ncbi:hypothetical protein CD928_11365 [Sphingopyxis sp. GW247-27LB]|nr:hypothetical protein CD928_11365 [Sphingopyxis sp. GW247-27LB]
MGMKALERGAYGAGRAIGWTIKKAGALALRVGQLAAATAAIGGTAFLGGIIATTGKFEQFQIMLEGTEGSAEKAKKAMAWVQDFAKRTPYELDQVMEAFVQLKAYGIDPMDGSLRAAGDAAAGMSKQLIEAVEALADAGTGEFERLKAFGITARVAGERVTFSYVKNNKEIRKEVAKTSTAMREAISGIWNDRFGGGMNRQAGTLFGIFNNLKDQWTAFMLKVGQAGVFDSVKSKLQGLLNWLNKKLDDGSIDTWAKRVSIELEKVVKWIGSITEEDFNRFKEDLTTIAKAVGDLARSFSTVYGWVKKIDSAWASTDAWVDRWGIGGPGWGDLFGKKSSSVQRRQAPMNAADRERWRGALQSKPIPRAAPMSLRGKPINPAFFRSPSPQAPATKPPSGKIVLEVHSDRGTKVQSRSMQSQNLDLALVYRGGAMVRGG